MDSKKVITFPFGENYIERLADYINDEYVRRGCDLRRIAVVFGGRRPALFLKKALASRRKGAFYPPCFFTIDELMSRLAQEEGPAALMQEMDSAYLIYQLARQKAPMLLSRRESFAEFLPWAQEIVGFIDHLDLEYVPDERLEMIQEHAQIGFSVPEDIQTLLKNIVILRRAYHETLHRGNMSSRGRLYQQAAECIGRVALDEFDHVLFCNFFYFNRSEQEVVLSLYRRDKASLIFQGDQRKWPVLDRLAVKLSCTIKESEEIKIPSFDLHLYATHDAHAQSALAREVFDEIPQKDKTVMVLPDPEQIIPVLSQLMGSADEFNISMGYPLKRSNISVLFELIFQAQKSRKGQLYYAKDYLRVLRHPLIKNLDVLGDLMHMRKAVHHLEDVLKGKIAHDLSGSLFLRLEDVVRSEDLFGVSNNELSRPEVVIILQSLHDLLFEGWQDVQTWGAFVSHVKKILDFLILRSPVERYPLNGNILNRLLELVREFESVEFIQESFAFLDMVKIFTARVEKEMVAFIGSPLKGLQLLGLFETRALNFDHVIVLDVNEGALPKLRGMATLIPHEVFLSLGIDRLEMEEEIQRYQFMRLISSAKSVHLIYQENKEKERSRFVEELVWEAQKTEQRIDARESVPAGFQVMIDSTIRRIPKTPEMIAFLKNFRFSPSSLNTYLQNPLDFYFQYVLNIREQEDLLDEPDARQLGIFLHELLEETFAPFVGKKPVIDPAFVETFFFRLDEKYEMFFGKNLRSDNFLLKTIMRERMARFLERERVSSDRQVEEIISLEKPHEEQIALPCGTFRFKYVFDRIDRMRDGSVMVLDYKTGSVDLVPSFSEFLLTCDLSRDIIKQKMRSFQLPLYYHGLMSQFPGETVNAGLYSLRTLEIKPFIKKRNALSPEQMDAVLKRTLNFIIEEILNPEVDFMEDTKG